MFVSINNVTSLFPSSIRTTNIDELKTTYRSHFEDDHPVVPNLLALFQPPHKMMVELQRHVNRHSPTSHTNGTIADDKVGHVLFPAFSLLHYGYNMDNGSLCNSGDNVVGVTVATSGRGCAGDKVRCGSSVG